MPARAGASDLRRSRERSSDSWPERLEYRSDVIFIILCATLND